MDMKTSLKTYGLHVDRIVSQIPDSMISHHAHDFHELYFLNAGQRRYFIGHRIYDVLPGNLVLIPHTELHRTTSTGVTGYDRYVLYVYDKNLQGFIDTLGREAFEELMTSGCMQLPQVAVRQIQKDMELLMQECKSETPYGAAYANHLVQDILLCAIRYGRRKRTAAGESADKVQDVARYISENYAAELTLQDAADMVFMEQTYFSKRFKQLTGFGFHEYLTQTRIRAAERLLENTTLSVSEIAERCGFSGSNYFGDVFRRWKGISPSVYRKKQR